MSVSIPIEALFPETLAGYGDTIQVGDVVDVLFWEPSNGPAYDPWHEMEHATVVGISGTNVVVNGAWDPFRQETRGDGTSFSVGQINGSWWRTFRMSPPEELVIEEEEEPCP